jgi:probable HAF family extracellular repeat protein
MTFDDPYSDKYTYAFGINDGGQIVGSYSNNGPHGFIYSGGTFTTIDVPGSGGTTPIHNNSLGQFGRTFVGSGPEHGFL